MNKDFFFAREAGKRVIENNIPMKRLGQIEELKGVAILLASQASSFMTGSVVAVGGSHTVRCAIFSPYLKNGVVYEAL